MSVETPIYDNNAPTRGGANLDVLSGVITPLANATTRINIDLDIVDSWDGEQLSVDLMVGGDTVTLYSANFNFRNNQLPRNESDLVFSTTVDGQAIDVTVTMSAGQDGNFRDSYWVDRNYDMEIEIEGLSGDFQLEFACTLNQRLRDESFVVNSISATSTPHYTVIDGSNRHDDLRGTGSEDVMSGFGGHDTLRGGSGDDSLDGGNGNDKLLGGDGEDDLTGGKGRDMLAGGAGGDSLDGGGDRDHLRGGDGNDDVSGGADRDRLYGETGDDTMSGGDDDDRLYGGSGDDDMSGDGGEDRLIGGAGADNMDGGANDDRLFGNTGDDTLDGGAGDDMLIGGSGVDAFVFSGGDDEVRDWADGETIIFDAIAPGDVTLTQDRRDVIIEVGNDSLVINRATIEMVQDDLVFI